MLVNFDKEYRVIWYNEEISKEDATIYFSKNTIWLDTDFPEAVAKEGYRLLYCVNADMKSVRVEYEAIQESETIQESEPTQLDIIEAEVKKKNADIANAAIEVYEKELHTAYREGVNSL